MIYHAALALGGFGKQHFLNNLGQSGGMRFNSTGQRITTQRSKTHSFYHGDKQLAGQLGQNGLN